MSLDMIGAGPARVPDIKQTQFLTAALGGGITMLGQVDTSLAGALVDLPDGSGQATLASIGVDDTLYLADGRYISGNGQSIMDPAAQTITWVDQFGVWHTDSWGSIAATDPATGQPTTLDQVLSEALKIGSVAVTLTDQLRKVFGGSTTPGQRPINIGGHSWRLPNGQIVTGIPLPDGRFQLPDGTIVAGPPGGGGSTWLLVGLAAVGIAAAFGMFRGRRKVATA